MLINREEFLHILSMVQPGLATKGTIEQADNFVFRDGRVYTFNDEIAVSHPLPDGLDKLDGAVRAKELFSFLSKFKKPELELDLNEKEMLLKTKRSKSGLMFDTQINLPIEEMSIPEKWLKLPGNFVEAVKICSISAGTDMTAPALCCLHFKDGVVETTDNYRITRKELDKKAFKKGMLVPANSLRQIGTYMPTKYAATGGWAHFSNVNDVVYSCRTFDDTFPDIAQFLDGVDGVEVEFPEDAIDIINRVSVFTSNDASEAEVEIRIEKNWMTFRCQNDVGWTEEKTRVEYKGKPAKLLINPNFLAGIIKHSHKCIIAKEANRLVFVGDGFKHLICLIQ